jgi:hypothetical protein
MEKTTLISTMKNEGPFILEWVAYHKAIGFSDIVIASNDCEDGSNLLLDALCQEGVIAHRPHTVPPDQDPQWAALLHMRNNPLVSMADWLMCLDADEFLNISNGGGQLRDLIANKDDADAVVVLWRNFGSAGLETWAHGSVLETFTLTESTIYPKNRYHKTIFRNNGKFREMDAHYPLVAPNVDVQDIKIVNSVGERYQFALPEGGSRKLHALHDIEALWTWEGACVNHYAVKSRDLLALKRHRGDNVPGRGDKKFAPDSWYVASSDRNEIEDRTVLRIVPALQEWMRALRSSPRIRNAEENTLMSFEELRARVLRT